MTDEQPEPLFKRLWIAQPKKLMRYARFTVREIDNANVSKDDWVSKPSRKWGWNDRDFEMYHHQSVVDELRAKIKDLEDKLTQHVHDSHTVEVKQKENEL